MSDSTAPMTAGDEGLGLTCDFCGKPIADDDMMTDDNEGIAHRSCGESELATQRVEAQAKTPPTVELAILAQGGKPQCVVLNNHRIAGGKAWGGGTILKSWQVPLTQLRSALPQLAERDLITSLEAQLVAVTESETWWIEDGRLWRKRAEAAEAQLADRTRERDEARVRHNKNGTVSIPADEFGRLMDARDALSDPEFVNTVVADARAERARADAAVEIVKRLGHFKEVVTRHARSVWPLDQDIRGADSEFGIVGWMIHERRRSDAAEERARKLKDEAAKLVEYIEGRRVLRPDLGGSVLHGPDRNPHPGESP